MIFLIIIVGIILMAFSYRFISKQGHDTKEKTIDEKIDILDEKLYDLNKKIDSLQAAIHRKKTYISEEDSQENNFEKLMEIELSKDINTEIDDDYKQGFTVDELASKYKKGKGEIELRLNLKK